MFHSEMFGMCLCECQSFLHIKGFHLLRELLFSCQDWVPHKLTFIHLTNTFSQSDLQSIQGKHFISLCIPWKSNPWPWLCCCYPQPVELQQPKITQSIILLLLIFWPSRPAVSLWNHVTLHHACGPLSPNLFLSEFGWIDGNFVVFGGTWEGGKAAGCGFSISICLH